MNVSNSKKIFTKEIADFSNIKDNTIIYGKVKKNGTIYSRKKDILDSLENFFFKGSAEKKYKNTIEAITKSLEKINFPEPSRKLALSNINESTVAHGKISAADLKRAEQIANQISLPPVESGIDFFQGSPVKIESEYKIVLASTLGSSNLLTDNDKRKWQASRIIQELVLNNASTSAVKKAENFILDHETFSMEVSAVASKEVFTLIDLERWGAVNNGQIELDSKRRNDNVFSGLKNKEGAEGTCVVDIYPGSLDVSDPQNPHPIFSDEHLRAMLNAAQETIDAANNEGQKLRFIFATEDAALLVRIKSLQ